MSAVVRPFKGSKTAWEYDIRIDLPDGREIRERRKSKVKSKSGTQRWAEARERELIKQTMAPATAAAKLAPTLREHMPVYMAACEAERLTPATMALKRSGFGCWLLPALGDVRLSNIDAKYFDTFKGKLAALGVDAANNQISLLSAVLHHATDTKVIAAMPCKIRRFKSSSKERPFYTFEAFDQLLGASGDEQRILILLGGHCGLRAGELVGLEWPDVDFDRRVITVQRAVWQGRVGLPKHGKIRYVPMSDTLARALKAFRHLRGPRVFYLPNGKPVNRKVLGRWLREVEAAAELDVRGHIHALRHSFCSHLALRGVPARTIMELAGHHALKVTQRYMHLAPGSAADAVRTFDRNRGEIVETAFSKNVTA